MPQLTATFYQFTKRRNSTMRPSSTGTQLNIIINDGASSLLNPSIRVQYVAAEPYQYNYCYINMLHITCRTKYFHSYISFLIFF